ncbi:unnamed protein product [Hermetia illucens]|uniref:Juvenile hormone acid methyltransferase n=1 Tax=Hermetia illucens TaxID=343691 RepID=A0A7R8UES0_HERIL|nr:juvenile hormone acid O-methyltransferase-like [Hermetia illucens]CAD7079460.1 unnamed protein product [Hermetia illucens]
MNAPVTLYHRSNDVQRQDAKDILDEYSKVIKWRKDGRDSLLDIGCGSGDVMIDFILPIMPKNFSKLMGVDIAEDMVKHAKLLYQRPKISFDKCNIAGDIKAILVDHSEGFDHVTSFYCLHWEWNQKKAIKNIFDLLKHDGDCLLVFLAKHPIFDVYKKLSQNNKWAPFMEDVDRFISPYHHRENPAADFNELLKSTGFTTYNVKLVDKTYVYGGLNTLKRNVSAINPFLVNMSPNEREEFFEDYIKTIIHMNISQKDEDENDYKFISSYKLLVAYARK